MEVISAIATSASKTENIALLICFIIIYFGYKKVDSLEKHIETLEKEKVNLTGRINFLEGQNSLVETLANQAQVLNNQTAMIMKMDEKINLLHERKSS
jgi:chaperonin cofactor prefoldin